MVRFAPVSVVLARMREQGFITAGAGGGTA
jgi:hypothetical protein